MKNNVYVASLFLPSFFKGPKSSPPQGGGGALLAKIFTVVVVGGGDLRFLYGGSSVVFKISLFSSSSFLHL